jgi:1-aminocyclopropane-1-carboxylate deaminase/D-cysteine desulfhydrase-like pyridoxal-dependent ACC family enzyme
MRLVDDISSNQTIVLDSFLETPFSITIKREDLLHPLVSGNKFRKLKYNIVEATKHKKDSILTFGGAYSNHIAATAVAGELSGLKTIGVIRGEELKENFEGNRTLEFAKNCGMTFEFIPRAQYRLKETKGFLSEFTAKYPSAYVLPEGGTNALAIKGCAEILTSHDSDFDYICTAVGTGGTLAGLVSTAKPHQSVIGYSALKGTFQSAEIEKYTSNTNFVLKDDYCFGGYAKIDSNLVRFMNEFKDETGILLDPIYTAKMLFGIIQDIRGGFFPKNSRILAIHTGGLQGISGMNQQLKKKNLPQIHV